MKELIIPFKLAIMNIDIERFKAVILLSFSGIIWTLGFILSAPMALFFWFKRILVKAK